MGGLTVFKEKILAFSRPSKLLFEVYRESLRDLRRDSKRILLNQIHIKGALNWILEAQKVNKDGGVPMLYSLKNGWSKSFPETTGYIIPTVFNASNFFKNKTYRKNAFSMADWLLRIQWDNGSFPAETKPGSKPIVFNTGQIIFGLVRAYKESKLKKYKQAAIKAANWLVKVQGSSEIWNRYVYNNIPHVYNTRTAWALLEAYKISKDEKHLDIAKKNLDWALTQQLDNGWFKNNGFYIGENPLTHAICYATEGLLESGVLLKQKKYINAAKKTMDSLLKKQREDGSFLGRYDKNWNPTANWICLTGDAQASVVFLRLFEITKDKSYKNAAIRINNHLKKKQDLNSINKGIKGGVKGSYPIYGGYQAFNYCSWAAKFLIDALLLEEKLK